MTEVFISFSVSPLTLPLLQETRRLSEETPARQQVALARCNGEAGGGGRGAGNTHTSTMMTMSFGEDAPCMYLHKDPGITGLICFINPETTVAVIPASLYGEKAAEPT